MTEEDAGASPDELPIVELAEAALIEEVVIPDALLATVPELEEVVAPAGTQRRCALQMSPGSHPLEP